MDRSWMNTDRRSYEYKLGVAEFCEFASGNARDPNRICCPCMKCGNTKDFSAQVIKDHLFINGIDIGYDKWTEHGEVVVESRSDMDTESVETEASESETVEGNIGEDYEVELDSDVELEGNEDEQLSSECNEFRKFVDDANKPLFPGCTRHTKMNVLVRLYNLKAKHGMSDAAYSDWLIAFSEYLPIGNEIPTSVYEAKKSLSALGMDYTKIHACPNDCILYRKQYSDDIICPRCGISRWKVCKNNKEREGVPAKVLWYFPPIPRFKRMFQSIETSKNLTWHASERKMDGLMCHPADSASWKLVDEKWPDFGNEPRNLRLALSSNGFNPHSTLSSKYSCWPVILVTYNLPPWLVMKRKHMLLTLLISGPKQPGNDIDIYLEPLIDDLKQLWEGVNGVYDAIKNETFTLKALLFWTINDFPAYGNLSGSIVKGYNACPICLDKTEPTRLVHGGKMAYTIHRRFLGRHHPYRKLRAAFDNRPEHVVAPVPLTGEEMLRRLEEEVPPWPYGKKNPPPAYKGAEDETRPCWKKKSIFFQLEYWKYLPVRHCLDVMHIEKNVCDSLIGTLLNIPGKTKDGLKTRLDLVELGIRCGLHPNLDGPKKKRLPLASWNLTLDEKRCMCGCFQGMKVPENYSSNISSLVSMEDLRLTGLKSHDCHALMQQLLPVAIRGVLEKPVRVAVIRLCMFFSDICSKTIDVSRLPKIQSDLVETLCELEKYFPPSFFDIMIHLTVHLVREVELCGPVCFRWMYHFERYMKVCKGYVRNKRFPEGCIAECYIAEEAVELLAELLLDDKTVGIPEVRNANDGPTSGATVVSVFGLDYDQAHLCVLQNTDEFKSYFMEHMECLKREFPKYKKNKKWLVDKQNQTFADWVKERVAFELNEPGCDIPEIVRWLADKPGNEVPKYSGYRIGGVQFNIKMRDDIRLTQSSGVYLVAETPQVASAKDKNVVIRDMSFYGVITEIWELDYDHFRVPIFKCDWVENEKGVKVDDLGFTLVNLNRKGHLKDSFVLGKCVEQIFYVVDPVDHRWSVVLRLPKKDYNDLVHVDELGDTILSHPPIATTMPSIQPLDRLTDEDPIGYKRPENERMASSKSASVAQKTKSKEKRLKTKKRKSFKSSTSTSFSDRSYSKKKGLSKKTQVESTGGLKLLKRHAVTMSRITSRKSRRLKKIVLCNRKGTPCGKVAKELQSYIGVLARRKVPIIRESWRKATTEEKNKIWSRVQIPFFHGPENKKMVMESAATKWREFKSRLTSNYIVPYVDDPEALKYPPDDYPFINADHWTQFVKSRTTPSFLEKRAAQQERRKKNLYPHRLSRKGYAWLEEELANEMGDEDIDRATLWIKGRQSKDGSFKDEETKKKAEKIDALKKRVATGELSIEGSDDVLTLALGTPEHGGRVRGVGGCVTPSTYFHLPKRRKESIEATVRVSVQKIMLEEKQKIVEEAREKIIEEAKEKLVADERAFWGTKFAELEAKIIAKEAGNCDTPKPHVSGQGSCSHTIDETAQEELPKGVLEEEMNHVDGKAIHGALDMIENKVMQHKRKGSKVMKGGPLDVSPSFKDPNQLKNMVQKETLEENVSPNDIQVPQHVEGAEYVDLTLLDSSKKSSGAEIKCKLALGSVEHVVAYATVMDCDDNNQLIHGAPLGDDNLRVSIYEAVEEKAKVPFPIKDEIETVKQAMGSWVAWPKELIIRSLVKKPIKDNAEKKKKKKETVNEDSEVQFSLASMAPTLPESLKMLCQWGEDKFRDGHTISFHIEPDVFGYSRKTFLMGSDVRRLVSMREVSGTCIVVYQSDHWMLTIVDPDQGTAYFLDPLKRRLPTGD